MERHLADVSRPQISSSYVVRICCAHYLFVRYIWYFRKKNFGLNFRASNLNRDVWCFLLMLHKHPWLFLRYPLHNLTKHFSICRVKTFRPSNVVHYNWHEPVLMSNQLCALCISLLPCYCCLVSCFTHDSGLSSLSLRLSLCVHHTAHQQLLFPS